MTYYADFKLSIYSSEEEVKERIQKWRNDKDKQKLFGPSYLAIAYCVFSNSKLKKIYDEFIKDDFINKKGEEKFRVFIGLQFGRFLDELKKEKDWGDDDVDKFIFENDSGRKLLQEKILRITEQIQIIRQNKELKKKEFEEKMEELFLACLKKESEDFFQFVFNKLEIVFREDYSFITSNFPEYAKRLSSEEIQRIFLNHLRILFLITELKEKILINDVKLFLSKLRIFEIVNFSELDDCKETLVKFYNKVFSLDKEEKVISFMRKTNLLFSNEQELFNKSIKDFQKVYRQGEFDEQSINYGEWESSSNLIDVFSGNKIRFDYDALLGTNFSLEAHTLSKKEKTEKEKESRREEEYCQKVKEAIKEWQVLNSDEIVFWQGFFFSCSDAISWVKEAFFVFIFPELQDYYDKVKQDKDEKKNFFKVINLFREAIELRDRDDKDVIQSDLILFETKEIKKHLIERASTFLKTLNEEGLKNIKNKSIDLEKFSFSLYTLRTERVKIETKQLFSGSKSFSLIKDFCSLNEFSEQDLIDSFDRYMVLISVFFSIKWEVVERKEISSGIELFLELETFRKKVLCLPCGFLYDFGKKIEEEAKKKGTTIKEEINFFLFSYKNIFEKDDNEESEQFKKEVVDWFLENKVSSLECGNWKFFYDFFYQRSRHQTIGEEYQGSISSSQQQISESPIDCCNYLFSEQIWATLLLVSLVSFVMFIIWWLCKRKKKNN